MRVQVIRAWARGFEQRELDLPDGARLGEAIAASGMDVTGIAGYAVFGERAGKDRVLREGDRVELLTPLLTDPKRARRERARTHAPPGSAPKTETSRGENS